MRARSIPLLLVLLVAPALSLAGCGSGDASIVTSDPLAVPPDFAARPPRVGNTAKELSSIQPSWKTVFRAGDNQHESLAEFKTANDPGETQLLREAGVQNAPANIRQEIASTPESGSAFTRRFVDKLIAWRAPKSRASNQAKTRPHDMQVATQTRGPTGSDETGVPSFNHTKSHSWLGSLF